MKPAWRPVLFFVIVLIITLLVNMPARHLVARIDVPEGVKISQLQGSLFSGRVATLLINELIIRDLNYRVDSACLLSANLCYQLNFSGGSVLVRYLPVTASIEISQLDAELSMSNLIGVTDQLLIKPSGSLHLSSPRLVFVQGKLIDIEAVAVWKEAGIAGEDINLGEYQMHIKKGVDKYKVEVVDNEAVLEVKGEGALNSDGRYSLRINIKSSPDLDARVKTALEFIPGNKQFNRYQVRLSGMSDKNLLSYISFQDP